MMKICSPFTLAEFSLPAAIDAVLLPKSASHLWTASMVCVSVVLQNVVPEKLFTKERAVKQLLEIIDGTTTESNGKFFAWDKQEIPWWYVKMSSMDRWDCN